MNDKRTKNIDTTKILMDIPNDLHKSLRIGAINNEDKLYDYIRKCIREGHNHFQRTAKKAS